MLLICEYIAGKGNPGGVMTSLVTPLGDHSETKASISLKGVGTGTSEPQNK